MSDTPTDNVLKLADHREPTVYTITIVHDWDGQVKTYIGEIDMKNPHTRQVVTENLENLLAKLKDSNHKPAPIPSSEIPA